MKQVLVLPGDGIGTEIMDECIKVLKAVEKLRNERLFEFEYEFIGGASIDKYSEPFRKEALDKANSADAVLLGAVGGPKWDGVKMELRPETGLLKIRKGMGLYANLRPVKMIKCLEKNSTLKEEIVEGIDLMIVRELIGGLYFGEPRGREIRDGEECGFNTMFYKRSEIERIGKIAFEIAQKRHGKVCSVDKANVLILMQLWRETINELHKNYQDIELEHMYVDAMSMMLVKQPKKYDVIVCENMFGDILSDLASQLVGSIGILPSASLGDINPKTGLRFAMYEPIHGSAPDIAGQQKANPIGQILSSAMMLEYSFNMKNEAKIIENAVESVLKNYRTGDLRDENCETVSTSRMGDLISAEVLKN